MSVEALPVILVAVCGLAFPVMASKLDFDHKISRPVLQSSSEVTFDPLAVLAILANPRATASAARLYIQPDSPAFRWPHMLQIGSALTPVSMLVRHLTGTWKSTHPGVDVCKESMDWIKVRSNVSSMNEFDELLVNTSNQWLSATLNFKPSDNPASDINIINVKSVNDTGLYYHKSKDQIIYPSWQSSRSAWFEIAIITICVIFIEILMGAVVIAGVIFSTLMGDVWALALFLSYTFHWFASWLVSFRPLVVADPVLRIRPDQRTRFAVFQREAGGAIIFKGPQDVMERWARTKWIFDHKSPWNQFVHWVWVATGSVAALASVACMVNMSGYLQLGFLGMLGYASIAEIVLTVLSRHLQLKSHRFDKTVEIKGIDGKGNDKWFKSIIQSTLGVDPDHRLNEMKWLDYRLMPNREPFQAMLTAMEYLNDNGKTSDAIDIAQIEFYKACGGLSDEDMITAEGMWEEIVRVWDERIHGSGRGSGNKV